MAEARFGLAHPGVAGLLGNAGHTDPAFRHLLSGDLGQMAEQREFLIREGYDVGMADVYPALKDQATFDKAITAIFTARVPGWWNYQVRLIEIGVCTKNTFTQALKSS